MNILLIAGHGDGDSGACGNGYREADLTREVVSLLASKLRTICDVTIADTKRNWFAYLGTNTYNFKSYDYVLEVHFNSGGGKGTEIFVTTSEKITGAESAIVKNMAAVGFVNRGVKRKNFRVISRVKNQGVSASLLEVCFIDSAEDVQRYQNNKNEVINAIVKGIKYDNKEDLELTTAEELQKQIADMKSGYDGIINKMGAEIESLKQKVDRPMIYNYIDNNMPEWAREPVKWCVEKGIIQGTDEGLNLNDTKLWMCVVLRRLAGTISV